MGVDRAYWRYWGKASPADQESKAKYHLLPYHCLDAAAVGMALLARHHFLRQRLARLANIPEETLVGWVKTLLAMHDLGKFAETFQQLNPKVRKQFWGEPKLSHYAPRHDSLGFLLWKDVDYGFNNHCQAWFGDEVVYDKFLKLWLPAVTGHHGVPPKISGSGQRVKEHFQPHDQESARQFCEDILVLFQPDKAAILERIKDKTWKANLKESAWLLAGIAVLCDWLGSDSDIFCYEDRPMPLQEYWNNFALPRAEQALRQSGVLPTANSPPKELKQLFPITTATPLQELCGEIPVPRQQQLFILEDVTGAGKTEAALLLAHRLISEGQAQGIYIALPTMATANAMYERMAKAYRCLFSVEGNPSLVLAHGARHLSEAFNKSLLNDLNTDRPYGGSEETASVQCVSWLADHRKKALLADVGVGTVDQALLGILPAKHQSLRLLGLANKVLVVDEVHACDPYMEGLLQALLKFHARLGGSAILLSATLPDKMRRELLAAFSDGLGEERRPEPANHGYPLLTHAAASYFKEQAVATRPEVERQVSVELTYALDEVYARIVEASNSGQCVCWVRNTVFDAREAYAQLLQSGCVAESRLDLFHSRFVLDDRLRIENDTLCRYGEKSTPENRQGRILIATQVVEQSLDLDFDFMVSDLAPIDLIIQRAGRLHRHVRDELGNRLRETGGKDLRSTPVLLLHTPEPVEQPAANWFKSLFPKANAVYPDTGRLWRTARLLARIQGWRMPEDARNLIETVYGNASEPIPEALEKASNDAQGERYGQSSLANFNALSVNSGYSNDGSWDDEAKIPTRLSDDSATVYLAVADGGALKPYADSGAYPWDLSSLHVRAANLPTIEPSVAARELTESQRQLRYGKLLELRRQDGGLFAAIGEGGTALAIYHPGLGLLLGDEVKLWQGVAVVPRKPAVEYDFSEVQHGAAIELSGKTLVSLYLDDDILAVFQARAEADGRAYQALINETLRISVG
jgi:CRISPR-associated endonuclease/helicase Cas3